ncbi:MAG: LysE family transporter, partial [Spirochaetota bacterium]
TRNWGFLTGFWVILGHALLEAVLIILLLLGFTVVLKNPVVLKLIGVLGGAFLLVMGISLILDVIRHKIPDIFSPAEQKGEISRLKQSNPVLGGILVSMSNPYWWLWWATVGFAFMIKYEISFTNIPALFVFFLGHEAGDLSWYLFISFLVFFGGRYINFKVYSSILIICGITISGFGIFLGVSPFIR